MGVAVRWGEVAEAGLRILDTRGGEAERLAPPELSGIVAALGAMDADDLAREFAIESTQFWTETSSAD